MTLNILAALEGADPARGEHRCKLQVQLDAIPEDTPGKADLVVAAETWGASRFSTVMATLSLPVSRSTIQEHRSRACACYR